ncbi:MAG: D-alanyl-D-alanine carboxypeptidase family protein [Desulforhopalus sp.]
MKRISLLFIAALLIASPLWASRAQINDIAKDPYVSALVVEAESGKILFEDNADAVVYPASVLKLMDLLVILDSIKQGTVRLSDTVQVTKEAARMGGSQVYLDERESFPVEDLLYALMVQSANDAAVALAVHVAGSTEGFVDLMNKKAEELGMKDSHFHSVHGLPPAHGQQVDQTTARDLALLCRELSKYPQTFLYTGTIERNFRNGEFIMRTHNHLLKSVDGADGFKTGFFNAAGFSIAATAKRGGVRIIAIVMGSKNRKVRDAKASELLATGFAAVPARPSVAEAVVESSSPSQETAAVATGAAPAEEEADQPAEKEPPIPSVDADWGMFLRGVAAGIALTAILGFIIMKRRSKKRSRYLR